MRNGTPITTRIWQEIEARITRGDAERLFRRSGTLVPKDEVQDLPALEEDVEIIKPKLEAARTGLVGVASETWQTTLPEPTEDNGALVFDLPPPVNLREEIEEDLWGLERDRDEPSEDSVKGRLGVAETDIGNRLTEDDANALYRRQDTNIPADDVDEGETRKWAAESGATVGAKLGVNLVDGDDQAIHPNALITSEGTAANIAGQGALATKSEVAKADLAEALEDEIDSAVKVDSNGAADKAFMSIAAIEITDELSGALPSALPVVGNLEMTTGRIIQGQEPTSDDHLVNKKYVDDEFASPPSGTVTWDDAASREHQVAITNGRITSWMIDESEQLA